MRSNRGRFFFDHNARLLLDTGAETLESTAEARARSEGLPAAVRLAGWEYIRPGERPDLATGIHAIVGLVTWDEAQIESLEQLADRPPSGVRIHVVDLDFFGGQELDQIAPGADPLMQAPLLAVYRDGSLVRCHQGRVAVKAIPQLQTDLRTI